LIRAGLSLELKGNLLTIFIVTLVPQQVEANIVAWMARHFFVMPLAVCYTLGYVIAAVSPSVTVPSLIALSERGYGGKNKVPLALIAAGTFEDICAII
jgi:solute carrier family 9B (sodium/hydrogen exchanger), member 1/2